MQENLLFRSKQGTGGSPITRILEPTKDSRYGKFALEENFLSTIYY